MFRRAIDLADLEWEIIVTPELEESEAFSEEGMTTTARKEMLDEVDEAKKKRKIMYSEHGESPHWETETVVSSSTTPAVQKEGQKESDKSLNTCEITENSLHVQFSALLDSVRIPDSEFNVILGIVKDVEAAFSSFSKNQNATVRVVMLNNWYLQLRHSTYDCLQLFVYKEDDSSTDPIKWAAIQSEELFEQLQKVDCFGRPQTKSYTDPWSDPPIPGQTFIHKESGIRFLIGDHPLTIAEAQRCRLLNYYLTFDTRIKSLIAIIYLWVRVNSVRMSRLTVNMWDAHRQIPDPGPLEWLLVVFLIREGIIPSVREIQQNRHNHLFLETIRLDFDMGFYEDKEYAERWSGKVKKPADGTDEFALSVLELTGKFFLFCASLNSKTCVINTKDGEILPRSFFRLRKTRAQRRASVPIVSTKLSPRAVERLRQDLNSLKYNEIKQRMNMIHPFNIRWRFSIDNLHFRYTVCPMMKTTGKKLNLFLRRTKRNSKNKRVFGQDNNFDLEGLLKITMDEYIIN